MTNYYIIKKNGKSYVLPFSIGFCVSKDGIEVLGISTFKPLWQLKPEDIDGRGMGTVDILNVLRHEYRRVMKSSKEEEELNKELRHKAGILKSNSIDNMEF